MARNFFDNLPSTRTPVEAGRMNALLDGDEAMGNIVVDSIRGKNLFNINGEVNVRSNTGLVDASKNTVSGNVLTCGYNNQNDYAHGQKFTDLNGKTFTVSAKCVSNGTGTGIGIYVIDNNNTVERTTITNGNTGSVTYTATSNNIIIGFNTQTGENAQVTDIQVEIGSSKTDFAPYQNIKGWPEQVSFNNGWMYATYVPSFGWNILVPIINPNRKAPTLKLTSAEYYNGSWQSINLSTANMRIDYYTETYAYITTSTSAIPTDTSKNALVRMTGTISINN